MEVDQERILQYQAIWNYFSGAGDWTEYAKLVRSQEGQRLKQNLESFWEKKQYEGATELSKEDFFEWVSDIEKMREVLMKKTVWQKTGKKGHRVRLSTGGNGFILGQNLEGHYTIRDETGKITKGVPQQLITQVSPEMASASEFLRLGDVLICKQGLGIIRYIGVLHEAANSKEEVIGVELKDSSKALPKGKHDGTFMGRRYFEAKKSQGLFITLEDINKFLTPEDLLKTLAELNTVRLEKLEEYKRLKAKLAQQE